MAEYREFPQPFLDQLANHILWHMAERQFVSYTKWMRFTTKSIFSKPYTISNHPDEHTVNNAMFVNKQWHHTFLRQIGKCTSIEFILSHSIQTGFSSSVRVKNKFLAKSETQSECKVYLLEELFARLIEFDYLKAKKFILCNNGLVHNFDRENASNNNNWMEMFVRLFLPNTKKLNIPAQIVDSNLFDEVSVNFRSPSDLKKILPSLLMLNRKSYQFSMLRSVMDIRFWLKALDTKFIANRVEKLAIEFHTRQINWKLIKWSEFFVSLLANCPNLQEIRLNFTYDYLIKHYWPGNDELEKLILKFFLKRANKLLCEILPSIEIQNPAERPNFHIQIAFAIIIPKKQYQAVENIFHLPIGSKFPAGFSAQFSALSKFSFEEAQAVLVQLQAEQEILGLSRIAKATDRYGNLHHFKFLLIGIQPPEMLYDMGKHDGIHHICDYDSDIDTGVIEY